MPLSLDLQGSDRTNIKQKTAYYVKIHRWYLFYLDSWWTGTRKILKDLNSFTPNLSFTHEASKNSTPFLNLKVKVIDGRLETDLYIKPTDRHQHLHYLLYTNHKVKNVFSPGLKMSFRSARKISSYLVRAKLYPLERTTGSRK